MRSKKKLEIALEKCLPFRDPKVELEQYVTPTPIAADLLNLALLKGDIMGKSVYDLGCGTGRLAIGAALLGAQEVTGYDIDEQALAEGRKNAEVLGTDVKWVHADIKSIEGMCDTVLQNPPFGVQSKGADRPFIASALQIGKVIYTMHKTTTRDFIKGYIKKMGGTLTDISMVEFVLPRSYSFHKKRMRTIEVDIYRIERRD